MKRLLLLLSVFLLCGFNTTYKNNTQTGKPDLVTDTMSATVGGAVPTPPNDATKFLNGAAGFTVPVGTYSLPTATSTWLGGVKPDGTSILNTAGAISVTPASVGAPSGSGTSTGTNTGDQTSVSGNAGTATKLATGRTIAITGPITYTSPSFDGSGNVTATATVTSQTGTGSTFVIQQSPLVYLPYIAGADSGTQQLKIGHSNGTSYWGIGRDNVTTGDLIMATGGTEYFRVSASGIAVVNKGSNIVYRCTGITNTGVLTTNSTMCTTGFATTSLKLD